MDRTTVITLLYDNSPWIGISWFNAVSVPTVNFFFNSEAYNNGPKLRLCQLGPSLNSEIEVN